MDSFQTQSPGKGLHLPKFTSNNKDEALIKVTYDLLDKVDEDMQLDYRHKNITLVFGDSENETSTFMQWLAGDNAKFICNEDKDTEDKTKIHDSNKESKSYLSGLFVDAKANVYFYLPGITDGGKSVTNHIAKTYCTKRVLDHAENIKIVFTIAYRSVKRGGKKEGFLQSVRHVADSVEDIEKFRSSIAMVVTEVEESNFVLLDNDEIVEGVADFLREVKQFCEENLKIPNISQKDMKYYVKTISFIDVILEKNGEQINRIGIFRRPVEPRLVGNGFLAIEEENKLETILKSNLQYASKGRENFSFLVPEEFRNETADLVREVNNKVLSYFNDFSHKILKYFTDSRKIMHIEIKSFTDDVFIDAPSLSAFKIFSKTLMHSYNIASDFIEEIKKSPVTEDVAMKVKNAISSFNISFPNESDLYKHCKYLNFLLTLTDVELNQRPWDDLFNSTTTHITESRIAVQNEIDEAAEKLNSRILSDLIEIAEAIQEHHSSKMKLLDIQHLPNKFLTECNVFSNVLKVIGNSATTKELVKTIHDYANMLDINVPKEIMLDITNQGRYLEFLETVSKDAVKIKSSEWVNAFRSVSTYLEQSQKWYTFLNALYDKFSEYEIQRYREMYNVANLDDWGKTDKPQGLAITEKSYNEFLSKITKFNVTEQKGIDNIGPTNLQLEELNHVLNLTLKHKINMKCEKSWLFVTGSYILTDSKKNDDMSKDKDVVNCLMSLFQYKNVTYSANFALHTIFITEGFLSGVPVPTFFAPKWEIIDKPTFNLSGSKGDSIMTPFEWFKPRTRSKAANGTRPGGRGADGRPGGPGQPGNNFFGIGDKFVNGGNLTIQVNGGEGGDGEHGGDGYSADNGSSASVPSATNRCQQKCEKVDYYRCQTISYSFKPGRCVGSGVKNCTSDEYYCKYKIFGFEGYGKKSISDGGNGGRGGKGAAAGQITLFELSGDSGIKKIANRGKDGVNGDGGIGGATGSKGDDIIVSLDSKVSQQWKLEETFKYTGKNGVDGGNTVGLLDPKPPITLKDPVKYVNKYKGFLRENLMDRFTRSRHIELIEKFDNNDQINSIYDTLGFLDEFEGLEEQLYDLNGKVDFVPFYHSLLTRIREYSKSPKVYDTSSEHKKILNFLYTAILGRVYNLKDDPESDLIVNLSGYLDIVKREIETLKDLQRAKNKADIISKHQERYKSNLDRKIEEAKHIVETLITPEMEKISKEMDKKIDLLIDETLELQKRVEKDREALIKKKEELENAMALRGLFSCLSIFGAVLSFFGPVGLIVGTVIGATSSVAENLVLDNQQQTLQIPPDVVPNLKILGDQIKSVREKKVTHLGNLLEEISQEIGKNPSKLGDMSNRIADLKSRLNKVKENGYDNKEIKRLEGELKQELVNKEGQLKIKGVVPDAKTVDALKVVDKVSQAVQLGSLLVDIYNKHKNDQEKVDAITDAIHAADDKIQKLKVYEEQIYEVIAPTLQNMEKNLQVVASTLEAKSQVSLEVTKWKVQSALKDMKLQMQQLTDGFQVKDSLARCIEKLDEAMTTLVNVYDRIQSYQDQKSLADYIADISSTSASNINISDPNLVKAVNNLEILIRSNVVLTQYKAAVNAFKQWVFPFANYYLENSMLPSQLELEKNVENLVEGAAKQIDSIKSKLDLYKTSVKKTDKFIQTGEFSSRYVSTEPFYVWKNSEYKDAISKLLSGQEVVLRADVKKSSTDKDAIKFSLVELNFKTSNETLQSEINYAIKGFDITATHLGNSYYRYADKIYIITSDSQTIRYSCEKNVVGEPVRKNIVFDKIKDGDLMLSPYTLWEIRMINSTRKISFHDLEIYKDYIDVEMSGYGSYVLQNVNGFKFAAKEYRSVGKFDEVDVCIESESSNSGKCTDLIGRMKQSVHQVEGLDSYITNGAASSLWSPLNYAFSFLKMHIALNFVRYFTDEVKSVSIRYHGDVTGKLSTNLECAKYGKIRREEKRGIKAFPRRNASIQNDKINKDNCIAAHGFGFNDHSEIRESLSYGGAKGKYSSISHPLEVNCTLLLADVVARTVTGNKYKQAVDECLLSPREKLQIQLEECVMRSEKDVKRHLHSLSRMADDEKSSWLNGVNSYVKSVFQYLGFHKISATDDFVEDVKTLFA